MTDQALIGAIRDVLDEFGGLGAPAGTLDPGADLFASGMTSFASVSVMLGIEERLDVTYPESMLKRSTFESINAIASSIEQLRTNVAD